MKDKACEILYVIMAMVIALYAVELILNARTHFRLRERIDELEYRLGVLEADRSYTNTTAWIGRPVFRDDDKSLWVNSHLTIGIRSDGAVVWTNQPSFK